MDYSVFSSVDLGLILGLMILMRGRGGVLDGGSPCTHSGGSS